MSTYEIKCSECSQSFTLTYKGKREAVYCPFCGVEAIEDSILKDEDDEWYDDSEDGEDDSW